MARFLIALALAACQAAELDEGDAFTALWSVDNGSTLTRRCDDSIYDRDESVNGDFRVTKTERLRVLVAPNYPWKPVVAPEHVLSCDVRFDVTGSDASAQPNQFCSISGYIRCSPTCVTGRSALSYGTLAMHLETDDALAILGTGEWVYRRDEFVVATCAETLSVRATRVAD